MNDEFYIGYARKAPAAIGRWIRWTVAVLFAGAIGAVVALHLTHRPFDRARSDARDLRDFEGILLAKPVPHLLVPRPQAPRGAAAPFSRYFLVGRGKTGPKPAVMKLAGGWVSLKASLIYREGQTILAVRSGKRLAGRPALSAGDGLGGEKLGSFTLRGEIVDSKCYLGVMRPGNTKTHRGCAIRCIAGGVPPVLLVRDEASHTALYFLLVGKGGEAVNDKVLGQVADPVEITGEVRRYDDLLFLYADPSTYRRL